MFGFRIVYKQNYEHYSPYQPFTDDYSALPEFWCKAVQRRKLYFPKTINYFLKIAKYFLKRDDNLLKIAVNFPESIKYLPKTI
jgi:hypothetical protein